MVGKEGNEKVVSVVDGGGVGTDVTGGKLNEGSPKDAEEDGRIEVEEKLKGVGPFEVTVVEG